MMLKHAFSKLDGHLQDVLKGASTALVIRVFGTVLGFIVSVMVARMLGADGSGVYFLTLSLVTIVATIARLGFDNTLVRFIASSAAVGNWKDIRFVHQTVMKLVAMSSILMSVIMFFSAEWLAFDLFHMPFMKVPLMLASAAVFPMALSMVFAESLRGLKKISASQWIKTVLISIGTLALLYPMVEMMNANGAVVAYVTSVTITAVLAWLMWRHAFQGMEVRTENATVATVTIGKLFQSSWPLFGVATMGLVMQQGATLMLGFWGTAEDIGIFNIASRVASLLLFPLMAIISIMSPNIASMYRQGEQKQLAHLAQNCSSILTWLVLPVAIILALFAEPVLAMFGREFVEGKAVLVVLLAGTVINVATGTVSELLMMSGHERDCRNVNIVGAGLIVIAGVVLTPSFGALGAALAVSLGIGAKNLIMAYRVKIRLGFWPMSFRRVGFV